MCEKEKYWIEYFNAVGDKSFYNIALGGDGGNTKAGYSEEKLKMSEDKRANAIRASSQRGEDAGPAKLSNADVILIIERLKKNEFLRDIAVDYNVSVATIHDIRRHKTWAHLTIGIEFDNITGRKRPGGSKPVSQYDLYGNFIKTYSSARDAEAKTGVPYRLISQTCNGYRKTTYGYIWKFPSNNDV